MIAIANLEFTFPKGGFRLDVPQLNIAVGEHVAVAGPSGTGKSTLLNLIAGILVPDAGTVTVDQLAISALSDAARRGFRLQNIGFVFQNFALIDYLTVEGNILTPARIHPAFPLTPALRARARDLAAAVGMADKLARFPARLSQGEQQRVAIARALLSQPRIILADEATGNLDPANKRLILDLLFSQARDVGATMVAVTHDHDLLPRFDRTIDFRGLQGAA